MKNLRDLPYLLFRVFDFHIVIAKLLCCENCSDVTTGYSYIPVTKAIDADQHWRSEKMTSASRREK